MADKCPYSQSYGISRSHVRMWELDYKEGRVMKNWCFWTVVLEKTVESPLDTKEIKPVNPKGKQPWTFIVKTDAEAEAPIFCTWCKEPTHWIDWLIGKQPTDAGKDWRQQQKGMTKNEMVGWYHWLIGHEFEKTSGDNWRTGKPGVLQSVGLQRVRHNWATEQQFYKKRILAWHTWSKFAKNGLSLISLNAYIWNTVPFSGMTFIWIWRFECPPPAKFWTKQPPIYSQQCRNNKENLLSHITRNPGVGFLEPGSQVHSFSISVVLSKSQSRSIFLLCRYHYLALILAGSCMDIRELPQLWVSHAAKKQGLLFLEVCF